MQPIIRTLRVANPHKRRRKNARRARNARPKTSIHRKVKRRSTKKRRQRKNPIGEGVLTVMANPRKKRRGSRSRRRKKNPFAGFARKRRRSSGFKLARRSFRRRRNPSVGGFDVAELMKIGAGAFVGSVATRGLTQAILKDKNTGWMGYGANALAAVLLGFAASKVGASKSVATGVAAGGMAALFMRIWSEKVSQTTAAAAMSGLGDIDFSDNGLGDYVDSSFSLPSVSQPNGNYQVVMPAGSAPKGASAGTDAPGGSVSRFASRW